MFENSDYNKNLRERANRLRRNMTKAEACLWKYVLRNKQLKDCQFRRQRPIDKYIVDFLCKELRLIIEVDGSTHEIEEVYTKDVFREKELIMLGYTVVRYTDSEVLKNIEGVRKSLEEIIDNILENKLYLRYPKNTRNEKNE